MKINFDVNAIKELRLDPDIQRFVDGIGREVAEKCGDGYEYRPPTRNVRRDRGIVTPVTYKAKYDNYKNLTLIRTVTGFHA